MVFKLILIAIPVFALPIAGLVELHIRGLTVELDILRSDLQFSTRNVFYGVS